MAEFGEWNRKGAALSELTAEKEYGVTRDRGATETEVKERKDRVDDAMHATSFGGRPANGLAFKAPQPPRRYCASQS